MEHHNHFEKTIFGGHLKKSQGIVKDCVSV